MEKIKILVKHPFKDYEVLEVKRDYSQLNEIIDCSLLDFINLGNGVVMALDDEGKLVPKAPNLKFRRPGINDIICGTVVIMKDGLTSLSDEEIADLKMLLPIHFHSFTREEAEKINPGDYAVTYIITWD